MRLTKGPLPAAYRYLGSRRVLKRGDWATDPPMQLYVYGLSDAPLYSVSVAGSYPARVSGSGTGVNGADALGGGSAPDDPAPRGPSAGDGSHAGVGLGYGLRAETSSSLTPQAARGVLAGTTFYIYGPDGLLATRTGTATHYVLSDHLGSTRVVLDASGGLVSAFAYDAWGERIAVAGPSSPSYQYTGQERDAESGLLNYRARLYDPEIGRSE